jgi:hypothetical protein
MSTASRNAGASASSAQAGMGEKSFFEQQRELLLKEIGVVCSAFAPDKQELADGVRNLELRACPA